MYDFFDKIGWSPSIGDPSLVGWLTVAAYFLCAYKSLQVVKSSQRIFNPPMQRQRLLWLAITGIMLFLGVNKQLDLQTFFTATARHLAWKQGWYEDRHLLQQIFIWTLGLAGLTSITALFLLYYKVLRLHAFAIVGLCALLVFIMIRASSFHNVDSFLGSRILGIKMNWLLELSGIALIMLNTRKLMRKRRPLIDIGAL